MSQAVLNSKFIDIVAPVIHSMPANAQREALMGGFANGSEELNTVEECFTLLTSKMHDNESLKTFFHCWAQTNGSAPSVTGLARRIMLSAQDLSAHDRYTHYDSAHSLLHVIDEDFGARGKVMHADLYYRMATGICRDDGWQSKAYRSQPAHEFREWTLEMRLRAPILNGLLFTLVHEIFTHGEVELILPMFQAWLDEQFDMSIKDARKTLAWISVHTGGLEAEHFSHTTDALLSYCQAAGETLNPYATRELLTAYLGKKAAVMSDLIHRLQ